VHVSFTVSWKNAGAKVPRTAEELGQTSSHENSQDNVQ